MRFTDFLIIAGCTICLVPLLIAKEMGHLSSGATVGLLFLIVAIGLTFILIVGARRTRRARELFVNAHRPLPDSEFLRQMDASGDYARFCLILRMGFAIDCVVPPEAIHPGDTIRDLEYLCFDGFFLHEIICGGSSRNRSRTSACSRFSRIGRPSRFENAWKVRRGNLGFSKRKPRFRRMDPRPLISASIEFLHNSLWIVGGKTDVCSRGCVSV